MFYHVITERCLPALIMYCRQFKYTFYIALVYTLKITYKKGIECPANKEYLKNNNKMSLPQRSLPQRKHTDL